MMEVVLNQVVSSRYRGEPKKVVMRVISDIETLKLFHQSFGLGSSMGMSGNQALDRSVDNEPGVEPEDQPMVEYNIKPQLVVEASDRLQELESYFKEAFEYVDYWRVQVWMYCRLPMHKDTNAFGEVQRRPFTSKEAARKLRSECDIRRSSATVRRITSELDQVVFDVLDKHGEVRNG